MSEPKVLHEFESGHPRLRFRLVGDLNPALQVFEALGKGDGWSYANTGSGHYIADLLAETARLAAENAKLRGLLDDANRAIRSAPRDLKLVGGFDSGGMVLWQRAEVVEESIRRALKGGDGGE